MNEYLAMLQKGKTFFGLTPSHIPVIKSGHILFSDTPAKPHRRKVEGQIHIISLNPQLTDSFGHPLAYDNHLYFVCKQCGVEFISAANNQLSLDLLESHPYLRAVFTDVPSKSGIVTNDKEPAAPVVKRFRSEVEGFVDEYLRTCKPEDKVILYFYTGGLPHIEVLYDIIKARPQVSAHINLFWCSWTSIRDEAFSERWTETLRKVLSDDRLVLTVPTGEMQQEIQEAAQVTLPVAPMPSTTFDDTEAMGVIDHSHLSVPKDTGRANFNILFPSLMRKPKGYDLSISVIRMLSKKQADASYQCTLRYVPRKETTLELINIAQEARGLVNIVEGTLPLEEFQRMVKEADIIVLPYQPAEFSNRTSGLVIDALLCGVPLVVQKNTWLGNIVAGYDCGTLAEKASPKAYVKAIKLVAADYQRYRKNAIKAGKEWLVDNNWTALRDFILEPTPPLDIIQDTDALRSQQRASSIFGKLVSSAAALTRSLKRRSLHRRFDEYLKRSHPMAYTIVRSARWSLTTLKNNLQGIGGIFLFIVIALYVAGALIESVRWYLVGTASALLLLGIGLLILSYIRSLISSFLNSQRHTMEIIPNGIDQDFSVLLNKQLDEREKQASWRTIKNLYRGERAFIVGNGPSLNRTPLHLLKEETALCFNRFDLMLERLAWQPTMYMCVDDRVAENTASQINEIIPLVKFAFFPDIHPYGLDFRQFIEDAHNIFWLSLKSVRNPGSYETLPACSTIGTVADLGLQVLAFMGFSPIYLVGVDLDYKEHETVIKHERGNWTATKDDDPSHFDPRYFGAGAKYHEPRPYDVLISGFQITKEILDRKGIIVLNAGVGGSLEIFPRVDFRSLFDFGEDVELEMLLDAIDPELRRDARQALRGDKVIEMQDNWNEKVPFQVATLQLAEQLIPKVIFTHIPYGPLDNRYLFVRREQISSTTATKAVK